MEKSLTFIGVLVEFYRIVSLLLMYNEWHVLFLTAQYCKSPLLPRCIKEPISRIRSVDGKNNNRLYLGVRTRTTCNTTYVLPLFLLGPYLCRYKRMITTNNNISDSDNRTRRYTSFSALRSRRWAGISTFYRGLAEAESEREIGTAHFVLLRDLTGSWADFSLESMGSSFYSL